MKPASECNYSGKCTCDQRQGAESKFCELCGDITSAPLHSRIIYAPQQFTADKQDTCVNCDSAGWINDQGYCQHCWRSRAPSVKEDVLICDNCVNNPKNNFVCPSCGEITDYIDSTSSKCVECTYASDWKAENMYSMNVPNCKSCGRRALVNKKGVCKTCHINQKLDTHYYKKVVTTCPSCNTYIDQGATQCLKCQASISRCTVCHKTFKKLKPEQTVCYEHLPPCDGCKKPFVPKNKYDSFCSDCKDKVAESKCVSCGKFTTYMSSNGKCKDCE